MPFPNDDDIRLPSARTAPALAAASDRRAFLERASAAAAALALAPLARVPRAVQLEEQSHGTGHTHGVQPWNDAWLARITGKHRQVFDTLNPADGFGLAFAMFFLDLNHEVYGLTDSQLTAVVGLRHNAMPMALPDALWERYNVGELMQISDRATGGPATRNPFLHADGVPVPGSDIPSLMKRGVIFTVCDVALTNLSARLARSAGVSATAAKDEWSAKLLPGTTLVPVGVMAVNLAQEHGCTYCYGG
jgi:intracellular sulfur oxidation DsrE/DsrF family protein